MRTLLGVFALLMVLAEGCAYTTATISPPPAAQIAKPSVVGKGREITLIVPFTDQRPQPRRCGMKKNGSNSDTADVRCSVAATDWVSDSLARGLTAAGYKVLVGSPSSRVVGARIEAMLLQFFFEPVIGAFSVTCETDLAVRLTVTLPSGVTADRTFYQKGSHDVMLVTDGDIQRAATTATRLSVSAMVDAITALLDRYPETAAAYGVQQ